MKYIVFLTINLKSPNKFFIGVHPYSEHFDGYLGDGIYIQQANTFKYPKTPLQYAVKKYGTDSFKRITLFIFNSKEEAYNKSNELINLEQSDVYNTNLNINLNKIYQFDLKGNLVKEWEDQLDFTDFYGYSRIKLEQAIKNKTSFLNSYWSTNNCIDLNLYTYKRNTDKIIYLYNQKGKLYKEFISIQECADYLKCSNKLILELIKNNTLYKTYYISDSLVDEFEPKPRRMYNKVSFYVYNENNDFLGEYKGKTVMPIIKCHSWQKIHNILTFKKGWYKDYYISLTPIQILPEKPLTTISVDIYTKYGEFIETLTSISQVRQKYNLKSSDLKNIIEGDKYCKEYIFKYHRHSK